MKVVSANLFNEKTVAEILGLKVATLRRWRWQGKGPCYRKIGSAVRYHPTDLVSFMEASKRRSTSEIPRG